MIIVKYINIVIPRETYYIIFEQDRGYRDNLIYWFFGENVSNYNGYALGNNKGEWKELKVMRHPDVDFCFKTYHAKDRNLNNFSTFTLIEWLIQRFPLFEILLNQSV